MKDFAKQRLITDWRTTAAGIVLAIAGIARALGYHFSDEAITQSTDLFISFGTFIALFAARDKSHVVYSVKPDELPRIVGREKTDE